MDGTLNMGNKGLGSRGWGRGSLLQNRPFAHVKRVELSSPTGAERLNFLGCGRRTQRPDLLREPAARSLMFALTPVVVFFVSALGMSTLLLILTATQACVLTEHLICRITGKATTILNSAGHTGVRYA